MTNEKIIATLSQKYKLGFDIDLDSDTLPNGLNEDIIKIISSKKNEPLWLLEWRLEAYRHWITLKKPEWANLKIEDIDFQDICYYSAPKKINSQHKDIDPELLAYYEKLGVPLNEREILMGNVAVDAVLDSVSVGTTFKEKLEKVGVIFCSFSQAVQQYPKLVQQYLGTVVNYKDNFYASLNSAVFSDGSFAFIPAGVKCPMELSTYFRINQAKTGQFERTLIIAEEGSYVSYLEGCFLKGTHIWTLEGSQCIESLKLNEGVYDLHGKICFVKSLMRRPYEGCIYSINLYNNDCEIHTTSEHPFWIAVLPNNDEKIEFSQGEWVKSENLKKGDYVFSPYLISSSLSSITKEQAQLIAYYILYGKNYIENNKDYKVKFSIPLNDTITPHHIIELLTCQFIDLQVSDYNIDCSIEEKNHIFNILFNSEIAYNWFIYHVGRHDKKLSHQLMHMPHHILSVFLDTFKSLNNINKLFHVEVDSTYLMQDLVILLNKHKIYPKITQLLVESNQLYKWNIDWNIEKDNHIIYGIDGMWIPIISIKTSYQKTFVYNFEVSDTNTYLVSGIAVHNCSSPERMENQLHAAVVEIIALEKAHVKYSTVQNWFPGNEKGQGGIYNFVTKRGECRGDNSHISWTQIETGSGITWKYPSVILRGKGSSGEFYSVALTNHHQQADTGTKMIHLGENTHSTIIAKSISAGNSVATYRGLVRIANRAKNARNFTQCDSLIFGQAKVHTYPYIENFQHTSITEHEATTSKISEENLFYLRQRGLSEEQSKNMLVNGFCKSVFKQLPAEFAVEAQKLLEINLEGSMG